MRIRIVFLAVALALTLAAPARNASAGGGVSISFFYDSLSPHGEWFSVGHYGRCWRPARVAHDWQPYLNGEWVYTDYGWTWVSSDPWGGDPFHYGTWDWDREYGWFWIPGTIWAPAWVTWHYSDSTIGWAPVRPSLSLSSSGYLGPAVTVSRTSYIFVPSNRFVGVNVSSARLPVAQNPTLLARTRAATRFASSGGVLTSGGPPIRQVEQATKRSIPRVGISQAHTTFVPLRDSLRKGSNAVIAPAAERAKFTGAKPAHEAKPSDVRARPAQAATGQQQRPMAPEQKPAKRENQAVKHENQPVRRESQAAKPAPAAQAPERREIQAKPPKKDAAREKQASPARPAPAARQETRAERPAPAPERRAPAAQPPGQVKRNEPAGAALQHGSGQGQAQGKEEKERGKKDR